MTKISNSSCWCRAVALLLIVSILAPVASAQAPAQEQDNTGYRFRVDTEFVLVNVVARDRNGNFVRDLPKDAFTILEDGKPQTVASFDFETADLVALPELESPASILTAPQPRVAESTQTATSAAEKVDLKNRRLIVLFFDLSSMDELDTESAVKAAINYVEKQATPADMVAVATLATSLSIVQDFTSDRTQLRTALARLSFSVEGLEAAAATDSDNSLDTGQAFTPDESEYNVFNTDRRLQALQSLSESLARIEQKKSIIYFSSGLDGTGLENRAQLRNAINKAVSSNVSIYPMDARGLQAVVPGGEASQASMRGTGAYSGRAMQSAFDSNFSSQETLTTLAADTGGRAFLDSNDFSAVFRRVQEDTSAYYVLSYRSTNHARDGRYRKIAVRVNVPGIKLEYRSGYYAPRDFQHSSKEDREQLLRDELASELSATDLDVYLSAAYFRVESNRFYVPVSLLVPGSQIPFTRSSDKNKATLDIIGIVRDELNRPVGTARDTVNLALDESQEVQRRNVQYQTGFVLPPGDYRLKFVLRENQSGRMGSFETKITVPDLKKLPLKMSAVVLGTQVRQGVKRRDQNPLMRDGMELIPNITRVFTPGQRLYFYYEVYDPARDNRPPSSEASSPEGQEPAQQQQEKAAAAHPKNPVRLLTSIQFFKDKTKVYESPLVEVRDLTAPDRKAAVFQFEVPLSQLQPGFYTCQVNVIDDAGGTFTFPRLALLIRNQSQLATA